MTDSHPRIYSALATVIIVALLLVWMIVGKVNFVSADRTWPPKHDSEIVLDEYAEIFDLPTINRAADSNPEAAQNEQAENSLSDVAPESGMETIDQGEPSDAPTHITQAQESPVQAPKIEKPAKQGPTAEEIKQQQEAEAKRKAGSQTLNAFRNAGNNNTSNSGRTAGDSGNPSGTNSAVNGNGTGRVGGGWIMPRYNSVASTVTGSVVLMVKIDKQGKVKSVQFQGGDAPAATDPAVRAACEREVRAHNFSRTDDNAPEESTAYITYRFR